MRIHHPNDDRLFPGRMDNQIGGDVDPEGEWAVDKILSHSGSKDNAIFEIKWKAGDITWLPYGEISHLHALVDYLELLGVKSISGLPAGTGKPPTDDPQVHIGSISFIRPLSPSKFYKFATRTRDFFGFLLNPLSPVSRILPCVSSTATDFESDCSSIHSSATTMSTPIISYPPVNNRGVTQTGKSTFILQHPGDTSGATVPMTVKVGTLFEIFEHQDAIQRLEKTTIELKPEPLAWDKFTKFWNAHALEDGPRFVTWNSELGLYLFPNKVVSLADFNISRRIPKITSDVTKVPSNDTRASRVPSHVATPSLTSSIASSAPANAPAPASLVDLLSPELQADLATTGLTRYVRMEKSKQEYFKQRDQERKAKDAAKRNEKKTKKKMFWRGNATSRAPNTSFNEDVVMTGPVNDNKPSSSKTPGA